MPLAFMASKILRMCTPVCWFTKRDDRDPCGLPSMSERTSHQVSATCAPVASAAESCTNQARASLLLMVPSASSRSEEHTSELQSLMRISYADFCLKKKYTKTIVQW